MSTNSQLVDGKTTLDQQQDTLNFMEQFTASKVIAYSESTQSSAALKANEAVLIAVPFGQQPPSLELVAVPDGGDAAKAISDQVSKGKVVIFHEKVWVESKETIVIGLRKNP